MSDGFRNFIGIKNEKLMLEKLEHFTKIVQLKFN